MGIIAILIPEYSTKQLNDSKYVPKSKRWKYMRKMINYSTALGSRIGTAIEQCVQNMQTRHTRKTTMRDRRKVAERMNNNRSYIQRNSARAFVAYTAFCFATQAKANKHDNIVRFDTDSAKVGIDNRCSACISHVIEDFEGPMIDTTRVIKGYGGTKTYNLKMGTLVWKWADNLGKVHKFTIPNSYYSPDGNVRLLSPQCWTIKIAYRHYYF